MKGKIIVIDGMDGTGKETQSQMLYDKLIAKGEKVAKFSFPNYDDDSSYFVKKLLHEGYCRDVGNPMVESLFFTIDRGITYYTKIKEKYEQGYTIILDRYNAANIIYHLHEYPTPGHKINYYDMLYNIEVNYLRLPNPDLVIVLYSEPEVSAKLLTSRYEGTKSDRDINESLEFQNKVYGNIKWMIDYNFDLFGPTTFIKIHDGEGNIYSREKIQELIVSLHCIHIEK